MANKIVTKKQLTHYAEYQPVSPNQMPISAQRKSKSISEIWGLRLRKMIHRRRDEQE